MRRCVMCDVVKGVWYLSEGFQHIGEEFGGFLVVPDVTDHLGSEIEYDRVR